MKKSEFIKKVLRSHSNTVFTNKEQIENAISVFQKFGMEPPATGIDDIRNTYGELELFYEWEEEEG